MNGDPLSRGVQQSPIIFREKFTGEMEKYPWLFHERTEASEIPEIGASWSEA